MGERVGSPFKSAFNYTMLLLPWIPPDGRKENTKMPPTSELVIKIHSRKDTIPMDAFMEILSGTCEALYKISGAVSKQNDTAFALEIRSIHMQSPAEIVVSSDQRTDSEYGSTVFRDFIAGYNLIDAEERMPQHFDQEILQSYSKIVENCDGGIAYVEYQSGEMYAKTKPEFLPKISRIYDQEVRQSYTAWTTLEGVLKVISGLGRKPSFKIKDILLKRPVTCKFDREILGNVLNAFEKRVAVYGKTQYNQFDIPVAIEVEKFEVFPEEHQLPKYADLPPLDVTNGMEAGEFLGRIRNAI